MNLKQIEQFRALFTHDLVQWALKTGSTMPLNLDDEDCSMSKPVYQILSVEYKNENESDVCVKDSFGPYNRVLVSIDGHAKIDIKSD